MELKMNKLNHFGSLVNLAFVDGEFTAEEYELLEQMATKLGLSKAERNMILETPSEFSFDAVTSLEERIAYVYDFFTMIYADHRLDESEYHLVGQYIKLLGFSSLESKVIINRSIELMQTDIDLNTYRSSLNSLFDN